MNIRLDDLQGPEVATLLEEHLQDMYATSPPESVHALDLNKLRQPGISFWTLWDQDQLAGCGALKQINNNHGELKSMRTAHGFRRRGVARLLLTHIIAEARTRGYSRLSLETGAMEFFAPARRLYSENGFQICGPFEGYSEDPHSVFMTLDLGRI